MSQLFENPLHILLTLALQKMKISALSSHKYKD